MDVWACGVTLFNMITGKYPFETGPEGTVVDLYERISKNDLIIPEDLSDPALKHLIKGI